MLKGCSRRELSARRRRKPCLAKKFSTGKQQRERRPLPLSSQDETSLDLKWRASKLCSVTPKPHVPWEQLSWSMHGAAVGTQAPGTWPLCVPWDLGPGKKSQQPQFRSSAIEPRCSIFQHPLPQNWVSVIAAESQSTPVLDRTRPHTRGLTLSVLAACAWQTRLSLPAPCSSQMTGNVPHGRSNMWSWHSASMGCSTPQSWKCLQGRDQEWPALGPKCLLVVSWYKFICGCEDIPASHWLDTGSVVPSVCTNSWYQLLPVTAQSSPLPAAWSASKCFQDSVCSFGIGCETRHKILMGCVIILACCLYSSVQSKLGEAIGRCYEITATRVERSCVDKERTVP